MDGSIWIDSYKDNPLTIKFLNQFGGQFLIDAEDSTTLFYTDNDGNEYDIHHSDDDKEDQRQYIRLLTQSIELNKNLLILREPYKD